MDTSQGQVMLKERDADVFHSFQALSAVAMTTIFTHFHTLYSRVPIMSSPISCGYDNNSYYFHTLYSRVPIQTLSTAYPNHE